MYYIKHAIIPIIYMLFLLLIALALIAWETLATWVAILLAVLNIALYCFIVMMMSYKDGEEALKIRHNNDLNRQRIIETGDDIPIDRKGEFKVYKGFITGLVASAPLIALMIIHAIVFAINGNDLFGKIAYVIYMGFLVFFPLCDVVLVGSLCFYVLLALPFIVGTIGVPYLFGAKKMQRVYDDIERKQQALYGDKN